MKSTIPDLLPSDETGLHLEALMYVCAELSHAFHVHATRLFEDKTEAGYQLRAVLRATFGTSNKERIRKMSAATFLKHVRRFDDNLIEAKAAKREGRKPAWNRKEDADVF